MGTDVMEERKSFWKRLRSRLILALGGVEVKPEEERPEKEEPEKTALGSNDLINVGAAQADIGRALEWGYETPESIKIEIRNMIAEELYDNGLIEYREHFDPIFGRCMEGWIVVVDKKGVERLLKTGKEMVMVEERKNWRWYPPTYH